MDEQPRTFVAEVIHSRVVEGPFCFICLRTITTQEQRDHDGLCFFDAQMVAVWYRRACFWPKLSRSEVVEHVTLADLLEGVTLSPEEYGP